MFFVEVRFGSNGKTYDYLCDIDGVELDDYVLVPAGNDVKEGKVVGLKYKHLEDMPLPSYRYKKVISKCAARVQTEPLYDTEPFYVKVIFEDGGKEYTYKCDINVRIHDYVRVLAQGQEKTAYVNDVKFYSELDVRKKVIRVATEEEKSAWLLGEDDYLYNRYEDEDEFEDEDEEELEFEFEDEEDETTYDVTCYVNLSNLSYDSEQLAQSIVSSLFNEQRKHKIDHNRMTDDRGWMINGKWLAEHERNMSNPGSIYDSRGFAKDPAYEMALKDNFYLEEETGYHGYDDPGDYVEHGSGDSGHNDCDNYDNDD